MMIGRSNFTFKRVTIVGVGLMGGSLAMALKKHEVAKEITGLSHRQASIQTALEMKAIDLGMSDVRKAVQAADLIVLATPVDDIIKLMKTIKPYLKRGTIITDVGSTKMEIVEAAEELLPYPGMFVGSHPLVGSEKKGVANAKGELFEGAICVMTPTKKTSQLAKARVKQMWTRVGATVKNLNPADHDDSLAYISHLPHLVAFGVMEMLPDRYLDLATKGLRDTTRIAASSPKMWNDICISNVKNVVKALDEYIEVLAQLRYAMINRDEKALTKHFATAKDKRDKIAEQ
ncbi:MAG: prephenate dehydrogenase/arogenate dehydrogenase family protein [Candidatus Omnitrophica bacterium]|nr:prephenate dehydrogenase/arogenate dehydrogenase family protein [Candidatus Omnitrophota bacterium]